MSFDVSDLLSDPDFVQPFQVVRVLGSFAPNGEWTTQEQYPALLINSIVLPAKLDQLQVLPEGERNDENIAIYSPVALGIGDMKTTQPDLIIYAGQFYRVAFVKYYAQCSLWYALATLFHRTVPL